MRSELSQARATITVLEKEAKNLLLQLHAVQLQLHLKDENTADLQLIKSKLVSNSLIIFTFLFIFVKFIYLYLEFLILKHKNYSVIYFILYAQSNIKKGRDFHSKIFHDLENELYVKVLTVKSKSSSF